jgi:hypothetical protein
MLAGFVLRKESSDLGVSRAHGDVPRRLAVVDARTGGDVGPVREEQPHPALVTVACHPMERGVVIQAAPVRIGASRQQEF